MIAKEKLTEMVQAAQNGDEQGIAELYDTFHQDIYYYIFKIVNDEELAADLTQDTFIDILQKIGTLREPSAFVTWSRQVAYSRCTAHFRKRKELLADEDEDGYSVFDTLEEDRVEFIPDAALDQEDLKATIQAMCDALPEEQRAALLMRYFEEMSVSQIAEIQGVSEGTVKSRLNYGRNALRKAVEDYEKKNGIKLHCAGVVPLLLWLFAQSGKGAAAATTTAAATATATAAAATTAAATATTATTTTAAAGASGLLGKVLAGGLATKLAAGGLAVAVTVGGVLGALSLRPKEEPKEKSMVWSGFGIAETPLRNRHYQVTLTEFTEDTVAGSLEVTYLYDAFYSTDFTGTGQEQEDGTVHYTLECETPVRTGADTEALLIYDPQTEQLRFDSVYYYHATMDRWPLDEGKTISSYEAWEGVGSCAFCRADDHRFIMQIDELTEISARGKITMYGCEDGTKSSEFTARGYADAHGSYYEAQLTSPWDTPYWTLYTFTLTYDAATDSLGFYGTWFDSPLHRDIP